jgi:molybdopterin-guanine dinucleotide biosynthesis protein B
VTEIEPRRKTPVIGIAGWKNSGKTTLVERLVAELVRRGWRVATVKHAHHEAQIDDGATDSARHRRAGAAEVALVTGARWAIVHELRGEEEPTLDEVLARLSPSDLVIVEGYKREPIPKIEVRRAEQASKEPLAAGDPNVIAIAADHAVADAGLPVFALDDIASIADFIAKRFGKAS